MEHPSRVVLFTEYHELVNDLLAYFEGAPKLLIPIETYIMEEDTLPRLPWYERNPTKELLRRPNKRVWASPPVSSDPALFSSKLAINLRKGPHDE